MSKNDGGQAFPGQQYDPDDGTTMLVPGMTLRDWFAGQALMGFLSADGGQDAPQSLAAWCYEQADAMLAEREREQ